MKRWWQLMNWECARQFFYQVRVVARFRWPWNQNARAPTPGLQLLAQHEMFCA